MKKIATISLLCAGMLLSLVGCQEKPVTPDGKEGKLVEFAAVSGNPATRTAYSGEGTTGTDGNLTWERIDWVEGDQVLIWSDKATSKSGSGHSAVYSILSVTPNGNESHASISDPSETGLRYAEEGGAHKFWGLYPATAVSTAPTAGSLSFSIPATQTGTAVTSDGNITYTPNMDWAVMLAAIEGAQPKEKVNIYFYPAFTAFEITFKVDDNYDGKDPVLLHHVTLSSSSAMVGTVAATIATGTRKFTAKGDTDYAFITEGKEYTVGASTYTASATAKTVTFNLPEAVELEKGKTLTLTIVTLPQNVNDLTIGMYLGEDGSEEHIGRLKTGTGDNKKNLAFAACQKHILRGVLLKPEQWKFSSLELDVIPVDWINGLQDDAGNTTSGVNPQASQFVVGNATEGTTRQKWTFKAGETVTINYKVTLPVGWTWKIEPVDADNAFTVTGTTTGTIAEDGTNVSISFTSSTAGHTLYFKTSVISPDGTKTYNTDSEAQLYDIRGYHTFTSVAAQ